MAYEVLVGTWKGAFLLTSDGKLGPAALPDQAYSDRPATRRTLELSISFGRSRLL